MNQKFPVWLKYATSSAVFIAEREVEIRSSTRGKMTKEILKDYKTILRNKYQET
ncbi:hypothetical protein I79_022585 [Cricetulus griseus]|uniref:Uncharacterized protein n=1 Tax=Cricetulus griseus TaxID=10029 RepID=G3IFR2_CRIGR|nr:hypothetical protein I79_022585 [Cricetulus griseus]